MEEDKIISANSVMCTRRGSGFDCQIGTFPIKSVHELENIFVEEIFSHDVDSTNNIPGMRRFDTNFHQDEGVFGVRKNGKRLSIFGDYYKARKRRGRR